jgi:hypothetical protein
MAKRLYKEGKLKGCEKSKCVSCCCDDDRVEEWIIEYVAFHERMKDYLLSLGIKIEFINDRVQYHNCSDGEECKFIKYSPNKDLDLRPIDCKIYPFAVDWNTIDFDKKIIKLYYWDGDCPLVASKAIPENFKKEVENIVKYNFAELFCGMRFKIKFINKVL